MGGLDVIVAGHSAQAQPIGDDSLCKVGPYTGRGRNQPKDGVDATAPSCEALSNDAELFMQEFEDVALLRRVWRLDDGNDDMSPEDRAAYRAEADKFLEILGRMADLEWTPADHAWFQQRMRRVLETTERGREEFAAFDHTPLLMDGRQRNAKGEDGAEQFNAEELRRLSARAGRPILSIGAHHAAREENAKHFKLEVIARMDAEDLKGLKAELELCEGARVLLTANEWVEAGLMNGALGWVRGYILPEGFDPTSRDPTIRAPICVLVGFDELRLGADEKGNPRTFFPDDPEKRRWVPIFRRTHFASSESGVARQQFPLTLAWAFTHWKAQGMTLPLARIRLGARVAATPGIGYVLV